MACDEHLVKFQFERGTKGKTYVDVDVSVRVALTRLLRASDEDVPEDGPPSVEIKRSAQLSEKRVGEDVLVEQSLSRFDRRTGPASLVNTSVLREACCRLVPTAFLSNRKVRDCDRERKRTRWRDEPACNRSSS